MHDTKRLKVAETYLALNKMAIMLYNQYQKVMEHIQLYLCIDTATYSIFDSVCSAIVLLYRSNALFSTNQLTLSEFLHYNV